jgi:hypothetical protein
MVDSKSSFLITSPIIVSNPIRTPKTERGTLKGAPSAEFVVLSQLKKLLILQSDPELSPVGNFTSKKC